MPLFNFVDSRLYGWLLISLCYIWVTCTLGFKVKGESFVASMLSFSMALLPAFPPLIYHLVLQLRHC